MALRSGRTSPLRVVASVLSISHSLVFGSPDASPAPIPRPVHAECPSWYDPFHPKGDSKCPLPPYPKPFEPGTITTRFFTSTLLANSEGYNVTYAPTEATGTEAIIIARVSTEAVLVLATNSLSISGAYETAISTRVRLETVEQTEMRSMGAHVDTATFNSSNI